MENGGRRGGGGERELADDSQGRCVFGEFPMPIQGFFLLRTGGRSLGCHNTSHTPMHTPLLSHLTQEEEHSKAERETQKEENTREK